MTSDNSGQRPRRLGLPVPVIIGLAALAAPRVVVHDLGIIEEGTWINSLFVFVPLLIWVVTVVLLRAPRPFVSLLVVGAVYGIFLAAGHLLLWEHSFPSGSPQLGGKLAHVDSFLQELLVRTAVVISSVVTGTLAGVITGVIAKALRVIAEGLRRREATP